MHAVSETDPERARYFYDLPARQLLLGKVALDCHLESGGHPADIYELPELLRNTDIEIPFIYSRKEPATKDELLDNARWLYSLMDSPGNKNQKRLNATVILRASRLGISHSIWEIENHPEIGSLTNLYAQIDAIETKHSGLFDSWTLWDYATYISRVAEELGRRPNREDLRELAKTSLDNPHPETIETKVGSLRQAYDLAGFPNIHDWRPKDFVDWGVKVMAANDGKAPSQNEIDWLSKKGVGPSATTVAKHFNKKITIFQDLIKLAYGRVAEQTRRSRQARILQIKSAAFSGELPPELIKDADSEEEIITREARYRVITEVVPDKMKALRTKIALSARTYNELVVSIQELSDGLELRHIENSIYDSSYFSEIWSDNFMQTLKLPGSLSLAA